MANGFGRNITFFLFGALLGGVAVALTTPFTGKRVRRTLRNTIESCSDELADTTRSLRETSERLFRQGEKLVESAEKLFA
ncbi:MAG TPA: YtxH domain-containing protein [Bryobacteraceae bacterium]|nr:YtxH domain-containing protein [Bryobacteraceae bacterium]